MGQNHDDDRALLGLLDDLEQQADGLHRVEREAEVADLAAAEYAGVDLRARLEAALGDEVEVRLRGGQQPRGTLARVGDGWVVIASGPARWLVVVRAVLTVSGLGAAAAHPSTRSVADTLSVRALVRRLADDAATGAAAPEVTTYLADGSRLDGRPGRVGADFLEVGSGASSGRTAVVPLGALAALRWSV